jgi:hypothetical protein
MYQAVEETAKHKGKETKKGRQTMSGNMAHFFHRCSEHRNLHVVVVVVVMVAAVAAAAAAAVAVAVAVAVGGGVVGVGVAAAAVVEGLLTNLF